MRRERERMVRQADSVNHVPEASTHRRADGIQHSRVLRDQVAETVARHARLRGDEATRVLLPQPAHQLLRGALLHLGGDRRQVPAGLRAAEARRGHAHRRSRGSTGRARSAVQASGLTQRRNARRPRDLRQRPRSRGRGDLGSLRDHPVGVKCRRYAAHAGLTRAGRRHPPSCGVLPAGSSSPRARHT